MHRLSPVHLLQIVTPAKIMFFHTLSSASGKDLVEVGMVGYPAYNIISDVRRSFPLHSA